MNSDINSLQQLLNELEALDVTVSVVDNELRCVGPAERLNDELVARLKSNRDALIEYLEEADWQQSRSADANKIPLSFAQQRLWFMQQLTGDDGAFHITLNLKIEGFLDITALEQALNSVVGRHEILRTRYPAENGNPWQEIASPPTLSIVTEHPIDDTSPEQQIAEFISTSARLPFDLQTDFPLHARRLRLNEQESILCLTLHHVACDAWSLEILLNEIGSNYRAALLGQPSHNPPLKAQYADFTLWQRKRLAGPLLERQSEYWRRQLKAPLPVMDLPYRHDATGHSDNHGAFTTFSIAADQTQALRQLGQRRGASLFMTLLTAFKVLLHRYSGQTDVIVGVPVANRQLQTFENLIGLFVNTLVLRSSLRKTDSFERLLDNVRGTTLDALAHQDLPFEKLLEWVPQQRSTTRHPLFQVKFRLENAPPAAPQPPGLCLTRLPQAEIKAKLDLSMDLYETGDGITGALEYNTALFDVESVERMAEHYLTLLQSVTETPDAPIVELNLFTAAQRQRYLNTWNDSQRLWPHHGCFHYLFEDTAAAHPDDTALVFDAESVLRISYDELNRRANQLAFQLRDLGIKPESVVGICLPRSPEMIIALLAVFKAGAAYLPLAAEYPPQRLQYMAADADIAVLLSLSSIESPLNGLARIDLDTDWPQHQPQHNPPRINHPDHLAYVIYTSGSTGWPKGVMIQHRGLLNLTEDKIRVCDVRRGDCVLQFFSFSFDASIPEIIMSLATGARLLLAPPAKLLPGAELADLIDRHSVTHITMTPSALAGLPERSYPELRIVLVGGEAPTRELINQWSHQRLFINAYGPTETTVNASMVACGNGHPVEPTLMPAANKQLYVLDAQMQLLPLGVAGELYIGGVGLARGYLNRPDLSAQQFVPNPFRSANSAELPPCLYRTGDLACQLEDGRIRILGRIDHQVKIRGFRIELGEIEHAIASHADVQAAAVIAVAGPDGDKRLAAFAVAQADAPASDEAVLAHLSARLPYYMVPSSLQWLPQLPLTAHGKIDNDALAESYRNQASLQTRQAPRDSTETQIADLFCELLGHSEIDIHRDFFEAGGHSLLATRLVARLLKRFDVEITVLDLFEAPTVAGLAQRIVLKRKMAGLQTQSAEFDQTEREEIEL